MQTIDLYAERIIDSTGTYRLINDQRRGRYVATVSGPVEFTDMGYGVRGGRLTDGVYPPTDILEFARRGERGLAIVREG